jgi:hypothetical protein
MKKTTQAINKTAAVSLPLFNNFKTTKVMRARKTLQASTDPQLQLWYSTDNQISQSTIFNQAHNRKPNSEHRQPGTQLQNFITRKLLYKNLCLNTLWKEEDIYYKTFQMRIPDTVSK